MQFLFHGGQNPANTQLRFSFLGEIAFGDGLQVPDRIVVILDRAVGAEESGSGGVKNCAACPLIART